MSALKPGARVHVRGRDGVFEILNVLEYHVGLVDPTAEPKIDDVNGQQVAHFAVRRDEVSVVAP